MTGLNRPTACDAADPDCSDSELPDDVDDGQADADGDTDGSGDEDDTDSAAEGPDEGFIDLPPVPGAPGPGELRESDAIGDADTGLDGLAGLESGDDNAQAVPSDGMDEPGSVVGDQAEAAGPNDGVNEPEATAPSPAVVQSLRYKRSYMGMANAYEEADAGHTNPLEAYRDDEDHGYGKDEDYPGLPSNIHINLQIQGDRYKYRSGGPVTQGNDELGPGSVEYQGYDSDAGSDKAGYRGKRAVLGGARDFINNAAVSLEAGINAFGGELNRQIDIIHDTDHGVRICPATEGLPSGDNDEGVCFSQLQCDLLGGERIGHCQIFTPKTTCCRFERTCHGESRETVTYFKVITPSWKLSLS